MGKIKRHGIFFLAIILVLTMLSSVSVLAKSKTASAKSKTKKVTAPKTTSSKKKTPSKLVPRKRTDPYMDVTINVVDKDSLNAIALIKNTYYGYAGIITSNKFYPYNKITKGEFIDVLQRLYSKKVPVTKTDKKKTTRKAKVTAKWACNKLSAVYEKIVGGKLTWLKIPNKSLTRANAAVYINFFFNINKALKPKITT